MTIQQCPNILCWAGAAAAAAAAGGAAAAAAAASGFGCPTAAGAAVSLTAVSNQCAAAAAAAAAASGLSSPSPSPHKIPPPAFLLVSRSFHGLLLHSRALSYLVYFDSVGCKWCEILCSDLCVWPSYMREQKQFPETASLTASKPQSTS